MRKSRLSKAKQDRLIEHFVACTTARCAAALVGVNRKTAAYYFHRLREIIAYRLGRRPTWLLAARSKWMKRTAKREAGPWRWGKSPGFRAVEAWRPGLHEDHSRCPVRYVDTDHQVPTALYIPTAGRPTMCWMYRTSSTSGSTIPSSLPTSGITSTVLRIFGTRRSGTCVNSMGFPRSISPCF